MMDTDKLEKALDTVKDNSHIIPLQPLDAIPITNGMRGIKIDPDAKYLVFCSGRESMDMWQTFLTDKLNPLPPGTPVYIVDDIDNAIKIYQILDTKVTSKNV